MLKIEHIIKTFNKGRADETIGLSDVSLDINSGSFVMVIGANGSGKSTLMNILQGSILADSGKILLNGADITLTAAHKRSRWISRVFQDPKQGTAPDLTVVENFRLAALRAQSKNLWVGNSPVFSKLVKEKIATLGLGLENKLHQKMGSLSGGQRQALTLLMSVMDRTDLLLMDEPTAALDPKSAELIMSLTEKINLENKLTTLLITHSMKDALQYGDRLLMLKNGKIIKDLNAEEKRKVHINDLYGWFE